MINPIVGEEFNSSDHHLALPRVLFPRCSCGFECGKWGCVKIVPETQCCNVLNGVVCKAHHYCPSIRSHPKAYVLDPSFPIEEGCGEGTVFGLLCVDTWSCRRHSFMEDMEVFERLVSALIGKVLQTFQSVALCYKFE